MLPAVGFTFTDTINLGAVILGAIIAVGTIVRILSTIPTRRENDSLKIENESLSRQLRECRDEIVDKARRLSELGTEKDHLQQRLAAERAAAQELRDRLEAMPDWPAVREFTEALLEHVDQKAHERQTGIIEQFARFEARREEMAIKRFEALLADHQDMMRQIMQMMGKR